MKKVLLLLTLTFSTAALAQVTAVSRPFPRDLASAKTVTISISIEDGGGNTEAAKWHRQATKIITGWNRVAVVDEKTPTEVVLVIRRGTTPFNRDYAVLEAYLTRDKIKQPAWIETNEAVRNALPGVLEKFHKSLALAQ